MQAYWLIFLQLIMQLRISMIAAQLSPLLINPVYLLEYHLIVISVDWDVSEQNTR